MLNFTDAIRLSTPIFAASTKAVILPANTVAGTGESLVNTIATETSEEDCPYFVLLQNQSGANAWLRVAPLADDDTGVGYLIADGESFAVPMQGTPTVYLENSGDVAALCFYQG